MMDMICYEVVGFVKNSEGQLEYDGPYTGVMKNNKYDVGAIHRRHPELLRCNKIHLLETPI